MSIFVKQSQSETLSLDRSGAGLPMPGLCRRRRVGRRTRQARTAGELIYQGRERHAERPDATAPSTPRTRPKVRELVDKNMLPYFDTAYSAQLVLAKHWRTATPEQRKAVSSMTFSISRCCRTMARRCWSSRRIAWKILPFQGNPDRQVGDGAYRDPPRTTAAALPVNYSLRQTDNWLEGVRRRSKACRM